MRAGRAFNNLIAVIVLIVATFIALYSDVGISYAATTRYSDVLDDLRKDETFNADNYPAIANDYSLEVIQVAEGEKDELFVYVYQPAAKSKLLTATDINISLSEEATGTDIYALELVSNAGVFQKYRVKSFTVSSKKAIRYYNISSIYRAFNASIDDENKNDNILEKVAFRVGKIFTATTMNGEVIYYQQPTYTIKIINPVTNYLIMTGSTGGGGLWWLQGTKWNMFDAHFIAFSTDWDIDRLVSADISYHYCSGTSYYDTIFGQGLDAEVSYGEDKQKTLTVNADEKFEHTTNYHGIQGNTYHWDKIQTTNDFIAAVQSSTAVAVTDTKRNIETILSGSEWVISFTETERTQNDTNILGIYKKYTGTFTKISNVTILRLEFESDGKAYNLGAVSNTVSAEYPEAGSHHWYDGIVSFFNKIGSFFKRLFNTLNHYTSRGNTHD